MGLLLVNTNSHHAIGVSGHIVFQGSADLVDKLESEATLHVTIAASADIQELWVQFPHLLRNGLILVAIMDQVNDALDTFLNTVKAISSQAMQQAWVDDMLDLSQ